MQKINGHCRDLATGSPWAETIRMDLVRTSS